MNQSYLLPAAALIFGLIAMVYMKNKYKVAKTDKSTDVDENKFSTYMQDLLNNEFSYLRDWMKGKPIDGFTTASVPQSTSDKVQEFLGDGVKKVALRSIGIRLHKIQTDNYWVLSGTDLHLFSTDVDGDLCEHLIFGESRIKVATLGDGGVYKPQLSIQSKASEENLPKMKLITFFIDGSPLALEIHETVNYIPSRSEAFDMKKQILLHGKCQIIGKNFIYTLQERFRNLRTY